MLTAKILPVMVSQLFSLGMTLISRHMFCNYFLKLFWNYKIVTCDDITSFIGVQVFLVETVHYHFIKAIGIIHADFTNILLPQVIAMAPLKSATTTSH